MDVVRIRGKNKLHGRVAVSGSKNACLPIFAATLLTEEPCIIHNVPDLSDIRFMAEILKHLGAEVEQCTSNTWRIQARSIHTKAPYDLVRKMRASICLLGPLLARTKKAEVSIPGGCVIGPRPIDLHLRGLARLHTDIRIHNGYILADGTSMRGEKVFLGGRYGSTVTGTANLIMAAVLTPGFTQIDSAACEPEVVDLCRFLTKMGAKIEGIGGHTLIIEGVRALNGCEYTVIGDRIEAGTFILAALMTRGEVDVLGFNPDHLGAFFYKLEEAEARFEPIHTGACSLFNERDHFPSDTIRGENRDRVACKSGERGDADSLKVDEAADNCNPQKKDACRSESQNFGNNSLYMTGAKIYANQRGLKPVELTTLPYPGFPTDLQAQFSALMAVTPGISIVTERIYPNRFMYVPELQRMGADIALEGASAVINGKEKLYGARTMASDLRASAALYLAGLCSENETWVQRIYHIDRGYEKFDSKLRQLGADIQRMAAEDMPEDD